MRVEASTLAHAPKSPHILVRGFRLLGFADRVPQSDHPRKSRQRDAAPGVVSDALRQFRSAFSDTIARAFERGEAAKWRVNAHEFAAAIYRSVESFKRSAGECADVERYVDGLRADDLALAVACRNGSAPAWEYFVERYSPVLQSAARAIARDETLGRELAGSLYAELFGLDVRNGRRRSLLDYFGGRSSLATWLRAVIAQRHIDHLRSVRTSEPLESAPQAASDDPRPNPDRARYLPLVSHALAAALGDLGTQDRLRLAYYYRDGLTLREIGRLTRDHESTVSRKLERTRGEIRESVERALRRDSGLSDEQIRVCYDLATEELTVDFGAMEQAKR
ncbi:MAG: RNA polymerase sigma factor [Candidatus Binataceae bacterium]